MASPISTTSSSEAVQENPPPQAESDDPVRTRNVMSMLSVFANSCMTELGFYPGMVQDLQTLKEENSAFRKDNTTLRAENAALKEEYALLKADIKKLWQDNETLDRSLKSVGPERDFYKEKAERYHNLLTASSEALPIRCHELQQEVERLRLQHAALTSTTERLVNDGLALGVLAKTEPSPDDMSLNVHYKRPTLNTTQARIAFPNVPQHINGTLNTQAHPHMSTVHQQPVFISNQSQQPSPTIFNSIHRPSISSVHIPSPIASQPQFIPYKISNKSDAASPVNQRRQSMPSISSVRPGLGPSPPIQHFQSQYNLNAQNSTRIHSQAGAHSNSHPQPQHRIEPSPALSATNPYSRAIAHSQRSASSPHTLSQVQMIPQSHSGPLINQPSRSTGPQSHMVLPNSQLSPVQMIPQSCSAPPENRLSLSSITQQHSVHPKIQTSHSYLNPNQSPISQGAPISRASMNIYPQSGNPSTPPQSTPPTGSPSTIVHTMPTSNGRPLSAPVQEVQIISKQHIAGPAPPTPPQSDKSLSPEQEQYPTLPSPILIREPLKRASVDDSFPSSPSKRMRFDEQEAIVAPVQTTMPVSENTTVPPSLEPIVQDQSSTADATVLIPESQFAESSIKAQTIPSVDQDGGTNMEDKSAPTSPMLTVTNTGAENAHDKANLEAPKNASIDDSSVLSTGGTDQTINNAKAEESDENEEEGDDESCTAEEALEEVLKLERSKNICTLCRARRERYPDKYTDAVFDPNTPVPVLIDHFTSIHPAVWNRLRGLPIAASISTAA